MLRPPAPGWRSATSRAARRITSSLPPWLLIRKMRRKPLVTSESVSSVSTRIRVSVDSDSASGKIRWWFEAPKGMVGQTSTGACSASRSAAAVATRSPTRVSTHTGRWGPCCSVAATGSTTVARGASSPISVRVRVRSWVTGDSGGQLQAGEELAQLPAILGGERGERQRQGPAARPSSSIASLMTEVW